MKNKNWMVSNSSFAKVGLMNCCSCHNDIVGLFRYYLNTKIDGYVTQCFDCCKDSEEIVEYQNQELANRNKRMEIQKIVNELILKYDLDTELTLKELLGNNDS